MIYRILKDSKLEPAAKKGMIVYRLKGWDYGSANDDNRAFGEEHISVTLNHDGGYPYFTIPKADLEVIE